MNMVGNLGHKKSQRTVIRPGTSEICLSFALALISSQASPATYSGSVTVTMTVEATCTVSTNSLHFGPYTGNTLFASGTVIVTCTNTTPYNITANAGQHWQGGWWYDAYMLGPAGALLKYNFYQDSAHTKVWGGTVGYDSEAGVGNSLPQIYTAYGVLPAGNYKAPGAYTDTLTFIVNY